jgi:hypothetical protein
MDKKSRTQQRPPRPTQSAPPLQTTSAESASDRFFCRNLLDRGETEDTAADFARRSDATSRMNRPPQGMRPAIAGKDFSPRPMPRPTRSPEESMRPVTRPDDALDRMEERRMRDTIEMGNRQDPGMSRREIGRRVAWSPAAALRSRARSSAVRSEG